MKKLYLDYIALINYYKKSKLSAKEISKLINCSVATVYNVLKDFNIKRRNSSDAGKLSNNKIDFIERLKTRIGKNNPFYGKHHSKETKTLYRELRVGNKNPMFGRKGKLSPVYVHGGCCVEYPLEFNEILKEQIRKRDKCKCKLCGKKQKEHYRKLDVHHIDYDKENCKLNNLIALCDKCNLRVNYNRDYWFAYFTYILENR